MRDWRALIEDIRFPGGWQSRGSHTPGQLRLSCVLDNSGAHDGREVEVIIAPDQLDTVARMVASAIIERDNRESPVNWGAIARASEREWRQANGHG